MTTYTLNPQIGTAPEWERKLEEQAIKSHDLLVQGYSLINEAPCSCMDCLNVRGVWHDLDQAYHAGDDMRPHAEALDWHACHDPRVEELAYKANELLGIWSEPVQ